MIVPESEQEVDNSNEENLHTADIWEIVKEGISNSWYLLLVKIHLDWDESLNNFVFLVRSNLQSFKVEHGWVLKLSQVI